MRTLQQIIKARETSDGDGVNIRRIAGSQYNALLDPFLMLDEINSDASADYIGGFPEHPHRGMETITFMKAGRMRHRDHMGNEGVIGPGDVQWMTAGKGVLHSEMPEQESGLLHGFQVWLNLPADEKMKPAAYREINVESIPRYTLEEGGVVSVVAGDVTINRKQTLKGLLPELSTKPVMIDLSLAPCESVSLGFNSDYPALVYVSGGELVNQGGLSQGHMGVYSEGDELMLEADKEGAVVLILSGKPIKEPIVQYGPFVMNTRAQIDQAVNDFRMGRLV